MKRFDFSSSLQRMSVIARDDQTGEFFSFVKGSPEMIKQLSINETLPTNFSEIQLSYTREGYRVIGCGYKKIDENDWCSIDKLSRKNVEDELIFLGFVIMKNKVKSDTKPAIQQLLSAKVRSVIVTGDNALTGISVAKEVGIVNPNTKIFLGEVIDNSIEWKDVDSGSKLDPNSLAVLNRDFVGGYELAVS